MTENTNPGSNAHPERKENTMNDKKRPDWIKNAARVDRPDITRWYKPEDGPIDGTLIWKGRQEHYQSGDTYNAYAIRETSTGDIIGVSERAGLRDLRTVKVGSKVFINPIGKKQLDNGRAFEQFEIFAEQQEPLSEPTKGTGKKNDNSGNSGPSDTGPAPSENVPF
jgi:hypothetical protein